MKIVLFLILCGFATVLFIRDMRSLFGDRERCRQIYANSIAGKGRLTYYQIDHPRRVPRFYDITVGYYLDDKYYEAKPLGLFGNLPAKLGEEVNILLSTEEANLILCADVDFEDGFLFRMAYHFSIYILFCAGAAAAIWSL